MEANQHIHVKGHVHPRFDRVRVVLAQQLQRHVGGAGLAVFWRGEPVVDIWGGDKDHGHAPWGHDTLSVSFSTTKGVASTLLHHALAGRQIPFDTPISELWREFDDDSRTLTVRDLMTHRVGRWNVRALAGNLETLVDWEEMKARAARMKPEPPYGAGQSAYHGLTYGFVAGGLLEEVAGMPFGSYLSEQLGKDVYVGVPDEHRARVAQLRSLKKRELTAETFRSDPAHSRRTGKPGLGYRLAASRYNPIDLHPLYNALVLPKLKATNFSRAPLVDAVIPAANGAMTARALAEMYNRWLPGSDNPWVSSERLREIQRVYVGGGDYVLKIPMGWRLGFHGITSTRGVIRDAFGHLGLGGSGGWVSPQNQIAVGYTTNALETSLWGLRIARINRAIMESIS